MKNMFYFNKVKISSFDQLAAELTAELTNKILLDVICHQSGKLKNTLICAFFRNVIVETSLATTHCFITY